MVIDSTVTKHDQNVIRQTINAPTTVKLTLVTETLLLSLVTVILDKLLFICDYILCHSPSVRFDGDRMTGCHGQLPANFNGQLATKTDRHFF